MVCDVQKNWQKYIDDSPSHNAALQIIHLNELPKAARVVVVCCFSISKGLRKPERNALERQIVLILQKNISDKKKKSLI